MVAVIASLLCSCTHDTSNSSWLVGTVWEADLAGREYGDQIVSEGYARLLFKQSGYKYLTSMQTGQPGSGNELGNNGKVESIVESKIEVEYDFPSISIPFVDNIKSTDDALVIAYYNTGIFSEDLKTLHFDTFTVFQGSFDTIVFQDVTFFRK